MRGLLGVRITFPFFLNVIPAILCRCFVLFFVMVSASSSRVCSPSPLTIMSTSWFWLSICWSMNVACGPPRMVGVSGLACFAECAAKRADCIVGVVEVMPTIFGLREDNFPTNLLWSISSASQSITVTSCPPFSRTAAK